MQYQFSDFAELCQKPTSVVTWVLVYRDINCKPINSVILTRKYIPKYFAKLHLFCEKKKKITKSDIMVWDI